jgi:ribosomal protein L11 methyltransferase
MPTVQVRMKGTQEAAGLLARLLEAAFEPEGAPVGEEETPAYSGVWTVDVILEDTEVDEALARVREALGPALAAAGPIEAAVLDDATNWIAMSEEIRRPVVAGRYFVHGRHDRARRPPNAVGIEIDAEFAFGTGHHATTWTCLAALDRLFRRRAYRRPLDLGTGTAVLAIAAARVLRVPVLATDIDPVAVRIAKANVALNGVAGLVACVKADGMRHRRIAEAAPFDLVMANILARPLMLLAAPVARALTPDATVVLSGLRVGDIPRIVAAYGMQRLRLVDKIERDGWAALVFERRPRGLVPAEP